MRHDRRFAALRWGVLTVLSLLGTVPRASAGVLRAEADAVWRPGSFETEPICPVPPCRSVPPTATDWRDPVHLDTGFSPIPRAGVPLALPPLDLALADPPWQSSPVACEHLPERALALDSRIRIPEPASIVLLTTGLVGLIARRYLRRMHA